MAKGKENTPHIGIYGRRNLGKSSLINVLAGQDIAIVSDHAGTTTDPVKKTFEISGFGPVVFIDTAGIDDSGELGDKRVDRSINTIETIDLAILVVGEEKWNIFEATILNRFIERDIPYIVIYNKTDLGSPSEKFIQDIKQKTGKDVLLFSTINNNGYESLIKQIKESIPESTLRIPSLLGDIISEGDLVLLITPIDVEAPEGRLILPQVQTIRDILDNDAISIVLKEREVDTFLSRTAILPALAITDSQIFVKADSSIPPEVPLTSFSIALARYKGDFDSYLKGTPKIADLKDGDRVLILESCTHHVSCDDIGRVKIPRWLINYTGKDLLFDVVAGLDKIEKDIRDYSLVIQCGGCMITRRQLHNRLQPAIKAGVPVTNYGMAIAYIQGIYSRAIAPFTKGSEGENYL